MKAYKADIVAEILNANKLNEIEIEVPKNATKEDIENAIYAEMDEMQADLVEMHFRNIREIK